MPDDAVPVTPVKAQDTARIRNVILVHGAFVDGLGWQQVYELLKKRL